MKIRELFDSPEKWTKGSGARNSAGASVPPTVLAATSWCLLGAVDKCYPSIAIARPVFDKIYSKIGGTSATQWNDSTSRTFEDVRKLVVSLDI